MAGNNLSPYQSYAMSPLNQTFVSVTCILSMIGSLVIMLSYVAWKDIRTVSRKVLVWLSVCDFFISLGNICGTFFEPTKNDVKCSVQSFVISAASISSFCWSVTLAVCCYLTIVRNNYQLFSQLLPYLHIFNWSIGLVINIVAAVKGMLGNTNDEVTAGWCWIAHLNCSRTPADVHCKKEIEWMLLDYKAIEVTAYAAICFLYLLIKINLKKEVKSQLSNPRLATSAAVLKMAKSADRKLILLPLVLILARIPGTIRFFLFALNKTSPTPNTVAKVLILLQGIGDSSQGLTNCIFFCFLQPRVRQHLKELLPACFNTCRRARMKVSYRHLESGDLTNNEDTSAFLSSKDPLIDRKKLKQKSYT